MTQKDLLDLITALDAALERTTALDAQTRSALASLQRRIDASMETRGASVTERLEALAVRFENEHPAAGNALRQAIDALAKAGI